MIRWIAHGCCIRFLFMKFYFTIFFSSSSLSFALFTFYLHVHLSFVRRRAHMQKSTAHQIYLPDKYWECCFCGWYRYAYDLFEPRAKIYSTCKTSLQTEYFYNAADFPHWVWETFIMCVHQIEMKESVCLFVHSFGHSMWIVWEWLII